FVVVCLLVSCHSLDLPSFPTRRSSDLGRRRTRLRLQHRLQRNRPLLLQQHQHRRRRRPPLRLPQRPHAHAQQLRQEQQPLQGGRSEEHTSELQSRSELVCRLLLEKKKN